MLPVVAVYCSRLPGLDADLNIFATSFASIPERQGWTSPNQAHRRGRPLEYVNPPCGRHGQANEDAADLAGRTCWGCLHVQAGPCRPGSLPQRRMRRTYAWYIRTLVFPVSMLLFHTVLDNLDMADAAFSMRLFISTLRDILLVMVDSR